MFEDTVRTTENGNSSYVAVRISPKTDGIDAGGQWANSLIGARAQIEAGSRIEARFARINAQGLSINTFVLLGV